MLADGADQIGTVREAELRAAAVVAQDARQARALAALAAARQRRGVAAGVTPVQACPHCGGQVMVLTTLIRDTMLTQEAERSHAEKLHNSKAGRP